MNGKICISKKFILLVFVASMVAIGTIYFSNLLVRKPTTVKTRAEEVKSTNFVMYGKPAEENEFPYFVMVHKRGKGSCGGVLIGEEWVLTAAHCVYDVDKKDITIIGGLNHIDANLRGHFWSDVSEKIIREDYINIFTLADAFLTNDIALLRLSNKAVGVPYLSFFNPNKDRNSDGKVDVNDYPEKVFNGKEGAIVGFGKTENGPTWNLLKGFVYMDDYIYRPPDKIHLLSKKYQKVVACSGDSGGPFIIVIDSKPYLVGIASFVDRLCQTESFYTSTTHFSEWIHKLTNIAYESGVGYILYDDPVYFYPPQISMGHICNKRDPGVRCTNTREYCVWFSIAMDDCQS